MMKFNQGKLIHEIENTNTFLMSDSLKTQIELSEKEESFVETITIIIDNVKLIGDLKHFSMGICETSEKDYFKISAIAKKNDVDKFKKKLKVCNHLLSFNVSYCFSDNEIVDCNNAELSKFSVRYYPKGLDSFGGKIDDNVEFEFEIFY